MRRLFALKGVGATPISIARTVPGRSYVLQLYWTSRAARRFPRAQSNTALDNLGLDRCGLPRIANIGRRLGRQIAAAMAVICTRRVNLYPRQTTNRHQDAGTVIN
mmetsp:Transcript_73982/g.205638  ORF Transcript_73982/g.205638 Transcript_73982/m.205638 type:complete len:105 (+) Transcript_73982:30-344(+)